MQRATQGNILLYAYDPVTGAPATGLASNAVMAYISKDGATPVQTTNSVEEVSATNQPGWYRLTLTATETDCASALITATHATAKFTTVEEEFQNMELLDKAYGLLGSWSLDGTTLTTTVGETTRTYTLTKTGGQITGISEDVDEEETGDA